jgi:hypothetical protein
LFALAVVVVTWVAVIPVLALFVLLVLVKVDSLVALVEPSLQEQVATVVKEMLVVVVLVVIPQQVALVDY